MIKCFLTLVIVEELILEAEDRNEHGGHAVVVLNDGFTFGHVLIHSPGDTGIYR